jgi:hypothetical protein
VTNVAVARKENKALIKTNDTRRIEYRRRLMWRSPARAGDIFRSWRAGKNCNGGI